MEAKYYRMFNYNRLMLPNKFLASLDEDVTDIETAKQKSGLTVGYPEWNFLYYCALCCLDRKSDNVIVETGTNIGCSTIILAQALIDSGLRGHVDSVEINSPNHEKALQNIESAGVRSRVTLHCDDSKNILERFDPGSEAIRFAFLDGSHLHAEVVREFEIISPKLVDESIVFFDNTFRLNPDDPGTTSERGSQGNQTDVWRQPCQL